MFFFCQNLHIELDFRRMLNQQYDELHRLNFVVDDRLIHSIG